MADNTMCQCLTLQCIKNGEFQDFDSSFGVHFDIFLLLLTVQFKEGSNLFH